MVTFARSRVRSLDYVVATEDHNVRSRAASYQKPVREQNNTSHTWRRQLLIERSILLLSLLSACAY